MSVVLQNNPKRTWADIIQQDEDIEQIILPPSTTSHKGDGLLETISYRSERQPHTKKSKYYKATELSRNVKVQKRIPKAALRRKGIEKFGDCKGQKPGYLERGITEQCPEPVKFEWEHERQEEDVDLAFEIGICIPPTDRLFREIIGNKKFQDERKKDKKTGQKFGKFRKTAPKGPDLTQMESTPCIRLFDLPKNTTFDDVKSLLRQFYSTKITLPRDRENPGWNRGFAFITFNSEEVALRAIETLNGHPYGMNILHAAWSRNYANFKKADPETQRKVVENTVGSDYSLHGAPIRGGPRKFINSKKGKY